MVDDPSLILQEELEHDATSMRFSAIIAIRYRAPSKGVESGDTDYSGLILNNTVVFKDLVHFYQNLAQIRAFTSGS